MYVDCEFRLKDDSKGIPDHILLALNDFYNWLREYGSVNYYIRYSGGGTFHFGYNAAYNPLECDLRDMVYLGAVGDEDLESFLWLKENTIYRGSSEGVEGSAMPPDDFCEYIENIIKHYKEEKSNGCKIGSA